MKLSEETKKELEERTKNPKLVSHEDAKKRLNGESNFIPNP